MQSNYVTSDLNPHQCTGKKYSKGSGAVICVHFFLHLNYSHHQHHVEKLLQGMPMNELMESAPEGFAEWFEMRTDIERLIQSMLACGLQPRANETLTVHGHGNYMIGAVSYERFEGHNLVIFHISNSYK